MTVFIVSKITHVHAILMRPQHSFSLHFMNNIKVDSCTLVTIVTIQRFMHPSKSRSLRMSISALSLACIIISVTGFSPADAQSNRRCSVCKCQLKNAENLIGFIDNHVQTVVQNILNAVLADQPSKINSYSRLTVITISCKINVRVSPSVYECVRLWGEGGYIYRPTM